MKVSTLCVAAVAAVCCLSGGAMAAEIVVLPGDPTWATTGNSGGGSSAITGTAPRSGNGSVELTGDRTRFGHVTSPVLLSSVTSFYFDWMVQTANQHHTPALRLHVQDGVQSSELIWEGVYNGGASGVTPTTNVWNTTSNSDTFWRWVTGSGTTLNGGSQVNLTIGDWAGSSYYTSNAIVVGISVGAGSGVGSSYRAFGDNITFGVGGVDTTYNFEASAAAPVPLPASALGGLVLLGVGGASRVARRRPFTA